MVRPVKFRNSERKRDDTAKMRDVFIEFASSGLMSLWFVFKISWPCHEPWSMKFEPWNLITPFPSMSTDQLINLINTPRRFLWFMETLFGPIMVQWLWIIHAFSRFKWSREFPAQVRSGSQINNVIVYRPQIHTSFILTIKESPISLNINITD